MSFGTSRQHWTDEEILKAIRAWTESHGKPPSASDWRYAGYGHPSSFTVRVRLGSMVEARAAAGVEPEATYGYGTYWTEDLIADAMLNHLFRTGHWPTERQWKEPHGGPKTGGAQRPSAGTVKRIFGTWTKARRFAGWRPVEELEDMARRRREANERSLARRRAARAAKRGLASSSLADGNQPPLGEATPLSTKETA